MCIIVYPLSFYYWPLYCLSTCVQGIRIGSGYISIDRILLVFHDLKNYCIYYYIMKKTNPGNIKYKNGF